MSTHGQPISFEHPFQPDETLTGERLGETFRDNDPHPYVRVRADGCATPFVVDPDDIR